MGKFVTVSSVEELAPGAVKAVEVEGRRIALCRVGEEFFAVDDLCTHNEGALSEGGLVNEHEIECPYHGARFDLRTGEALCLPATEPVKTYRVRVVDGSVQVEVP
jgi:3-phenylpropionate/trans-cinnamate dioxygenase ferredoxin subunit